MDHNQTVLFVQDKFHDGLTKAIERVAAMRVTNEASENPGTVQEALHALQTELEKLQSGTKKPKHLDEDLIAFKLATEAKENLRYEQLLKSIQIPYFTTDINGEVRKANQVACDTFNLSNEDSKGTPLVSCIAKSYRRSFRKGLKQLKEDRALFMPSLFFQQRDRRDPVEYAVHAMPVLAHETDQQEIAWILTPVLAPLKIGPKSAISNSASSIEPLMDTLSNGEEVLNAELQAFRGYAATHNTLSTAVDVGDLLESTVSEIANLIGDHCFLSVLSPERTSLTPAAAATNKRDSDEVIRQFLQAKAAPLSDNIAQKVIATQLPCIITNSVTNETPLDRIFHEGAVNMLMIPLRAGKTSLGLLNLLRDNTAKPYQEYEVVIVQNLADHVGLILRYLDSTTTYLPHPAAESLHAAFLGEVCTELQDSLHPLYGYAEMLKEQAQELKLPELENDVSLIVKTAAFSNQILSDTFEIVQIDLGIRKPSAESHPVDYFVSELVSVIRHFPGVEGLTFTDSANLDGALTQADILWAGQIIQKVMSCLTWETGPICVRSECVASHLSLILRCENGLFTHRLTGRSCAIGSGDGQNANQPFYIKGVAVNLAQRLCEKLGAQINYSSGEASFESVTFTFPLTVAV